MSMRKYNIKSVAGDYITVADIEKYLNHRQVALMKEWKKNNKINLINFGIWFIKRIDKLLV